MGLGWLCFIPLGIVAVDMIIYLVSVWVMFVIKKDVRNVESPFRKFNKWCVRKYDVRYNSPLKDYDEMYWIAFFLLFGIGGGMVMWLCGLLLIKIHVPLLWVLACIGLFLAVTFGARFVCTMFYGVLKLAKVAHTHTDQTGVENVDIDLDLLTSDEREYWEKIKAKQN